MSRLLALSLLALAAPCAAAEQVHPCQAETPPCSLAMAQARLYLDELDRKAGYAPAPPTATPQVAPSAAAANSRAAALAQAHPCQAETPPCSLAMAQARLYLDELDRKAGNFVAPDHHEYLTINRERNSPRQASNSDLALVLLEMARMQVEMMESEQDLEKVLELIKSARAHVPPDEVEALLELEEQLRETGPGSAAWARSEWYRKSKRTPKPRYHVPYPLSRELLTGAVNPCSGSRPACPWELKEIYDGLERTRDDKDSWHYRYYLNQIEDYYRHHRDYRPGAASPCDSAYASCPPELDRIYDSLERTRDDKDSWHYKHDLFLLEKYYRHLQP